MTPPRYIKATLPYPPSANAYWRSLAIGGRSRVVVSKEARQYKQAVALLVKGLGRPLAGPLGLVLKVYRPQRRGDLDNTLKVLGDALKGHLFADDSQIEYLHAERYDDKEKPRAEVEVFELGGS